MWIESSILKLSLLGLQSAKTSDMAPLHFNEAGRIIWQWTDTLVFLFVNNKMLSNS